MTTQMRELWHALFEQERIVCERVFCRIAQRLLEGQRTYGRLDLATDERDWAEEMAEEMSDGMAYVEMAKLQRELQK